MRESGATGMAALTELSGLLAENAELRAERVPLLASLCPPAEILAECSSSSGSGGGGATITGRHLNGILAIAQFLAHSEGGQHREQLLGIVLEFLKAVPGLRRNTFWPSSYGPGASKDYFPELLGYVVRISSVDSGASLDVSSTIADIIQRVSTGGEGGIEGLLANSDGAKAFLMALAHNCPMLHLQDAERVIRCLLDHWIQATPAHPSGTGRDVPAESLPLDTSGSHTESSPGMKARQKTPHVNGKLNSFKAVPSIKESQSVATRKGKFEDGIPDFMSPGSSVSAGREFSPSSTPKESGPTAEVSPGASSGLIPAGPQDEDAGEASPGYRVHQRKFEIQSSSAFERQEIAYRLLSRTLETTDADSGAENLHVQQLRTYALQQLKTLLPFLKIRRRDWPGDAAELKLKLGKLLQVSQAATLLEIKCVKRLESAGKSLKAALRESLPVLMDVADACNSSPWRRSRPCADLFDTLITGVAQVAVLHMGSVQRVLLRYKTCVMAACGQANAWGTTLGPVFESLIRGLCILIEAGWKTDKGAVESFLLYLAAHVREKDPIEKGHRQVYVALQLNVVSFIADLCVSLDKSDVVELILPIFVESLEEGDASSPSLVRLKLLEAVGRMACLGSEKSYREVVVLLTRSYLDKLSVVGSTHSRTLPAEGTTERLETLPGAFLQIAHGLSQAPLRANYRQRLLALCSDVGLIAEAKNGRTGADLLGPLLPAVAQASVDVDPTMEVEPSLLKLYRNLWFYVSLFGLAPPLPKGHSPNSKSGSQGGIFSHISSGLSQAISGGVPSGGNLGSSGRSMPLQTSGGIYPHSSLWAAAVEQISQGSPPLVVQWLENELELSALHNLGRYRGSGNEKEEATRKAALTGALGARVDTSSISGVSATFLLAVASLEILRFKSCGGVVRCNSVEGRECTSALSFVFKYLEIRSLSPSVHHCLVAIVQQAFSASLLWLFERRTATGEMAEQRDEVLVTHACFLLQAVCHREEYVRELAETLLTQMKDAFPQVLWSPTCLNAALSLVSDVPPAFQTPDSGATSLRSVAHQKVNEWISEALVLVPCTMQGLLQEQLRRLNRWQSATSDLLSVLAELRLDGAKTNEGAGTASIPAVMAAAVAVAGVDPELTQSSGVEVLSAGIFSANVKSSYAGEITGMKRLYAGMGDLAINTPSYMQSGVGTRRRMSFSNSDVSKESNSTGDHVQERDLGLDDMLTGRLVQQLQEFVASAERGRMTNAVAFRETCLRSAALILSEMDVCDEIQESPSHLLRLLCWCPVHIFTPEVLETGVFVWTWILSAAPQLDSHVLAELVDAWLWTVDTKKGLFASGVESSGPAARLQPQLIAGEPTPLPNPDPVLGIRAHKIWLGFFLDHFEAIRHGSSDQLLLISRMLQGSICRPSRFSSHPAAAGTFFTLLLFGLKFGLSQSYRGPFFGKGGEYLLADAVYRAGLSWFAVEPGWYDSNIPGVAQAEANSVFCFLQQLRLDCTESISKDGARKRSQENGFWNTSEPMEGSSVLTIAHDLDGIERRKQLLMMLGQSEVDRLETWANPLREALPRWRVGADQWVEYVKTAWSTDHRIAMALVARFPGVSLIRAEVTALVQSHVQDLFDIPEALPYIVTPKAVEEDSAVLQKLPYWAPCSIISAINFLTPPYKGHNRVLAYVMRVLEIYPPERVTFFMPQLVQSLRHDQAGLVEGYLMVAAQRSTLFAHILIWQLQGEEPPSQEDKELEKEPAVDLKNNLYDIVPRVKQRIIDSFTVEAHDIFIKEFQFFDKVTSISGVLYPLPKDERRAGIRRELEKIEVIGDQIYLPTDPSKLVRGIKLDSGVPLQSAAKVPIMITFEVVDKDGDPHDIQTQGCIFKVGDDCRQDVLALQVIAILRDIFEAVGLNLYLFPYGVLPTGYGRGIIEVVKNSRSRNQMAEIADGGLYEIFQMEYGSVGSAKFEGARDNFIISSAGYAVASLLLQPKDRHNGNLLFDSLGRLVHIDFGFILETSPGGNMRFESAEFKLSHEMTQLLDPSGSMKSDQWRTFVSLCVKGYLAARYHMDAILGTVLLMVDSGLPCFSRGDPIGNLRKRFHPEMTEREAANFMMKTCKDAYNHWKTSGYDVIQRLQQGIEM